MQKITRQKFLQNKRHYFEKIKDGAIFVYPTDTIYGIGCDATNALAVKKIREIKQSFEQPFSVISPSKEWIRKNLEYDKDFKDWLDKLPGPYTLIIKLKNTACVSSETTGNKCALGVRLPANWFSDVVSELNIPIITTSVNRHGERPITQTADIPETIKNRIDFVIEDGALNGYPSTIVDLTKTHVRITERK
jgi:tRNA threonylcarbamoyl adenosine modification protein (Sua5/YciO/YrdC/YwlC family)